MFSGAHIMVFTHDAEADRAFFRDVLELPCVDGGGGGGWLIFGLPPGELGFHPAAADDPLATEMFLMCEDLAAIIARLEARGVAADPPQDQGWGIATRIKLPSGARLGIYQPRHTRPTPAP